MASVRHKTTQLPLTRFEIPTKKDHRGNLLEVHRMVWDRGLIWAQIQALIWLSTFTGQLESKTIQALKPQLLSKTQRCSGYSQNQWDFDHKCVTFLAMVSTSQTSCIKNMKEQEQHRNSNSSSGPAICGLPNPKDLDCKVVWLAELREPNTLQFRSIS